MNKITVLLSIVMICGLLSGCVCGVKPDNNGLLGVLVDEAMLPVDEVGDAAENFYIANLKWPKDANSLQQFAYGQGIDLNLKRFDHLKFTKNKKGNLTIDFSVMSYTSDVTSEEARSSADGSIELSGNIEVIIPE